MRWFYRMLTIRRPSIRRYYLVAKAVPARIASSVCARRCEPSVFRGFRISYNSDDVAGSQPAPGIDNAE